MEEISKRDLWIRILSSIALLLTILAYVFYENPSEAMKPLTLLIFILSLAPYLLLLRLTFIEISETQSIIFLVGAGFIFLGVSKLFVTWAFFSGGNPFDQGMLGPATFQLIFAGALFIIFRAQGTMGRD